MSVEDELREYVRAASEATNKLTYASAIKKVRILTDGSHELSYIAYKMFAGCDMMAEGIKLLQNSANLGNPNAQIAIAQMLAEGVYVERDLNTAYKLAFKWSKQSPFAENLVGYILVEAGRPEEAVEHFVSASKRDFAQSSANLGFMLINDEECTDEDVENAIGWFVLAAEQGHPQSCGLLAAYYYDSGDANKASFYASMGGKYGDPLCRSVYKKLRTQQSNVSVSGFSRFRSEDISEIIERNEYSYDIFYTGQKEVMEQERLEKLRKEENYARLKKLADAMYKDKKGNKLKDVHVSRNGYILTEDNNVMYYDENTHSIRGKEGYAEFSSDERYIVYKRNEEFYFDD